MPRDGWPAGEWDAEPDEHMWISHGLACLIVRHPRDGHLCGYVEDVGPGVLTWDTLPDITHRGPLSDEPSGRDWVGFHFGGTWDYCPGMDARGEYFTPIDPTPGNYRRFVVVKDLTETLARQLALMVSRRS